MDETDTANQQTPAEAPQMTDQERSLRDTYDIPETLSIEDYATTLGWRPQDQFKGTADHWKPAEQFIEFGHKNKVIMKENLSRQAQELQTTRRELEEMRATLKELSDFRNGTVSALTQHQRDELVSRKAEAWKNGDFHTAAQIDEELRKFDTPKKTEPEAPQIPPQLQAKVAEWQQKNTWYGTDPGMTAEADMYGKQLISGGIKDFDQISKLMDDRMKRLYPEKFPSNRSTANPDPRGSTVANGSFTSGAVAKRKGSTYADLPADAKAQADRFASRIKDFDKEGYAKEYFAMEQRS